MTAKRDISNIKTQVEAMDFLRADLAAPECGYKVPPAIVLSWTDDNGELEIQENVFDSFGEADKIQAGSWAILVTSDHGWHERDSWRDSFGDIIAAAYKKNLLGNITKAGVLYSAWHGVSEESDEIRQKMNLPIIALWTSCFEMEDGEMTFEEKLEEVEDDNE